MFLQVLGSTTLMIYAVSLLVSARKWDAPPIRKPFSVRVVVPCYKEDIETLEETVECAIQAAKIAMEKGMANAGVLCHAVRCCAVPCRAVPCHARMPFAQTSGRIMFIQCRRSCCTVLSC